MPQAATIKSLPTNRCSTANVVITMKGTKNNQACGKTCMTGRTIPMDQLSRVMIWRSE